MFPNVVGRPTERGKWKAKDGPLSTNVQTKTLSAPMRNNDNAFAQRILAQSSVKWTPRAGSEGAKALYLDEGLEEGAVVNAMFTNSHINKNLSPELSSSVEGLFNQSQSINMLDKGDGNIREQEAFDLILQAVEAYPFQAGKDLLNKVVEKGLLDTFVHEQITDSLVNIAENPSNSWGEGKRLVELLSGLRPKDPSNDNDADESEQTSTNDQKKPGNKELLGDVQPGEMELIKVPLEKSLSARFPKFQKGEFGALNRIDRILTDGMAFKEKKRKHLTGTILLDMSGSMDPNPEEIQKLIEKSPVITVAMYSSHKGTSTSGRLVIIADKGKMVKDLPAVRREYLGGYNVVDIPALEWLNKMPSPRYWVSDGKVNGVNGHTSPALIARAFNIARMGNVKRVEVVDDVVRDLLGK